MDTTYKTVAIRLARQDVIPAKQGDFVVQPIEWAKLDHRVAEEMAGTDCVSAQLVFEGDDVAVVLLLKRR